MANFKVVFGLKDGKCAQKEFKEEEAEAFIGKKIGDIIKGDNIGYEGYEFQLTGGSDKCGFPMRFDVQGSNRKRITVISGVGFKKKGKGQRQKKTVFGNTVGSTIVQINLKVLKQGKKPLVEAPAEEGAPAEGEAKAEDKPAEEKKEEAKPEEKKEAPKEEKKEEDPKEKKKEEKPAEEKPAEKKEEAKE